MKKLEVVPVLDESDHDRVIEMAWEDRTPFEAIEHQFGLPEKEVIKLMRRSLKEKSFRLWRKRDNSGVSQKHSKKRSEDISRFRCSRQRLISNNKIPKLAKTKTLASLLYFFLIKIAKTIIEIVPAIYVPPLK